MEEEIIFTSSHYNLEITDLVVFLIAVITAKGMMNVKYHQQLHF